MPKVITIAAPKLREPPQPDPTWLPPAVIPEARMGTYDAPQDQRDADCGFESTQLSGATPIGASKGNRLPDPGGRHPDPQPFANLRSGKNP